MPASSSLPRRAFGALASATLLTPLVIGSGTAAGSPAGDNSGSFGTPLSTYQTGIFDGSAAEIVAFSARGDRAFVVNAAAGTVDVLDMSRPRDPRRVRSLPAPGVNSVDVHGRLLAVATQAADTTEPGAVSFYGVLDLRLRQRVGVGALPDMLTFTPDGSRVVVANEGEPEGYCDGQRDPRGSVSIISLRQGVENSTERRVSFRRFDGREQALRARSIRIFGPGASVSQDLEPEYVAVVGNRAFVSLQENNAYAVVDLETARVARLLPLGLKDHSAPGSGLDASDEDGGVHIRRRPVMGMYQPDAIASYRSGGRAYLVSANEGDAREYDCYAEEARVAELTLDPEAFPNAATLQQDAVLGRLTVTTTSPRGPDGYTELHAYGARSVTIRSTDGSVVWDSGAMFERITRALPEYNANNDETDSTDTRSDNKGPESEGVAIGRIGERTYAFVGLERTSGVVVLDVTNPRRGRFVDYLSTREESGDAELGTAGDLGPEGLTFVSAADSPNGRALLLVANEVSGTMTTWGLPRVAIR